MTAAATSSCSSCRFSPVWLAIVAVVVCACSSGRKFCWCQAKVDDTEIPFKFDVTKLCSVIFWDANMQDSSFVSISHIPVQLDIHQRNHKWSKTARAPLRSRFCIGTCRHYRRRLHTRGRNTKLQHNPFEPCIHKRPSLLTAPRLIFSNTHTQNKMLFFFVFLKAAFYVQ